MECFVPASDISGDSDPDDCEQKNLKQNLPQCPSPWRLVTCLYLLPLKFDIYLTTRLVKMASFHELLTWLGILYSIMRFKNKFSVSNFNKACNGQKISVGFKNCAFSTLQRPVFNQKGEIKHSKIRAKLY